jgi:hypothetical protein
MEIINKKIRTWSQGNESASSTPRKAGRFFGRKRSSSSTRSLGKPPHTPRTGDNGEDDSGGANANSSSMASFRGLSGRLSSVGNSLRKRANSLSSMRSFSSAASSDRDQVDEPTTPRSKAAFFKWTDTPRNMLKRSGGGGSTAANKSSDNDAKRPQSALSSPTGFGAPAIGAGGRRSGRRMSFGRSRKRTVNSVAHAYGAAEMQDSLVRYRRVIAGNNDVAIRSGAQLAEFLDCPAPLADAPFVKNLQGFTHKYLSHDPALAAAAAAAAAGTATSANKGAGIDVATALWLETVIHMRDEPFAREKCVTACLSAMGMDDSGDLSREAVHSHMEQMRDMIEAEAKRAEEEEEEEGLSDGSNGVNGADREGRGGKGQSRRRRMGLRSGTAGKGGKANSKWVDSEWQGLVNSFKDGRDQLTQFLCQHVTTSTSTTGGGGGGAADADAGSESVSVDRDLQTYVRLKVFLADLAPEHLENLPLTMDKNVPKVR